MKTEELMIGDYIKHGFGGIGKVTELSKGIVTVYDKGLDDGEGNCEVNFAENEIQDIPLTPEILEKNGFTFNKEETNSSIQDVYENYTKFFDFPLGKGFYIEYDTVKKVFHITDHCWIIFKYVHELQHALRLCNIDKEIVL